MIVLCKFPLVFKLPVSVCGHISMHVPDDGYHYKVIVTQWFPGYRSHHPLSPAKPYLPICYRVCHRQGRGHGGDLHVLDTPTNPSKCHPIISSIILLSSFPFLRRLRCKFRPWFCQWRGGGWVVVWGGGVVVKGTGWPSYLLTHAINDRWLSGHQVNTPNKITWWVP